MRLRKQIAGFNSTLNFEPVLVTKSSSTGQLSDQYWFIPPLPFRAPIVPSMRGVIYGSYRELGREYAT